MMTKTGVAALLLAAGALVGAPLASADTASFNDALGYNGVDISSVDSQMANVDLGLAICNMLNVTQNPNLTVDNLMNGGRHTSHDANVWMALSVMKLCPEMDYLTHYLPSRAVPNVPSVAEILADTARMRASNGANGPIADP